MRGRGGRDKDEERDKEGKRKRDVGIVATKVVDHHRDPRDVYSRQVNNVRRDRWHDWPTRSLRFRQSDDYGSCSSNRISPPWNS